ncbi:MAG: bifunctional adenosylcobinamide kinase/adenosylcobinamide-phosphate guanylyltransferase [Deltaproteobacteria bacterium]|nr:bifunctional adenosylcobinamide kinase/adenosylcobinamide-phosphate guanylyltransferase [Deltaproteobacteria bacterium]
MTFFLGGAKSGKTKAALAAAETFPAPRYYLATAQPLDDEMRLRIDRHKAERGPDWRTIEEPLFLARALAEAREDSVVLLDCLTLWLSNVMGRTPDSYEAEPILSQFDEFLDLAKKRPGPVVVVSNEVGGGIVPLDPLSRHFRDLSGLIHQRLAEAADNVTFVAAGLPLKLKQK